MSRYIIPVVGAGGFFSLSSPFDTLVAPGDRYICKALRKLSEYFANNEDPKKDIYDLYKIPEAVYDQHKTEDITIACLQSDKGHWLFVPVSYILKYPDPNGIPYRSISLVSALPAIPADLDLSALEGAIQALITDYIGVASKTKRVETSRVVLVSTDTHNTQTQKRLALINANTTDRSKYTKLLQDYQTVLNRVAELENFIVTNHTV